MVYTKTEIKGAGVCSYGSSFAGFGEPAKITWTNRQDFIIEDGPLIGQVGDYPLIDNTGDYQYNDNGYIKGQTKAQHLVYMALKTEVGSSSMQQLGNKVIQIQVLSTNSNTEIREALINSLSHLESLITIDDIEIVRRGTSVDIKLKWTDKSNNLEFENLG